MNQPQQLQIKADDATMRGAYANMMQVQHSKEEFVMDFMNLFPPQGLLTARVITSPGHLKRIAAALKDNLDKYEKQFGQIEEASAPGAEVGFQAR
ncbi:MAG: DUF3467 domain-containing protein [Candidatus Kerfeldbacteria bacterium]|nr:DUF3467 domain-containing protein [Candidatus Kerfeldbacteria bacterium]